MDNAFDYDPTVFTSLGCKFFNYFNYGLDSFSPWSLVYISVEKFFTIAYPTSNLFKKKKTQIIFLILLTVHNIAYHINLLFDFDVFEESNETTTCYFTSYHTQKVNGYKDMINCVLGPFFLMMCFSSLLIAAIFRSRKRVHLNDAEREKKRLKQDIKFSITSLSMNLLFVIMNMPLAIDLFLQYNDHFDVYTMLNYIYYASYSCRFYVFLTNALIRRELFYIFSKNNNQVNSVASVA
jgi:hypothetical protein